MKKRIIALLLTVITAIGTLPQGAIGVFAESSGNYILRGWDEDAKKVTETEYGIPTHAEEIKNSDGDVTLSSGWYVVKNDVFVSGKITVNGTEGSPTNIVLTDNCSLTVNEGIVLTSGHALNIYGQQEDSGTIIADGGNSASGIGGSHNNDGGIFTLYGGTVNATGSENGGAGIGGGLEGSGGIFTLYGGTVNAFGGDNSAGIGGGGAGSGGKVTVYAGTVNAFGGNNGAGIGGGDNSRSGGKPENDGIVTVWAGSVNAFGGNDGAGIGGGYWEHGGKVTVNGGTVNAVGGDGGAGIGGGAGGNGAEVVINGGIVSAQGNVSPNDIVIPGIGKGLGIGKNGTLSLGSLPIVEVGTNKDDAYFFDAYHTEEYVRIHFHTEETLVSADAYKHECSVCGAVNSHDFESGVCLCGETEVTDEIEYDGVSLTLSSNIYLNFYMRLTEEATKSGSMVFSVGSRTIENITAEFDGDNGRYYFACPVNVLEMAETVTATFTCGGREYVKEYSAADYIKKIAGNEKKYGENAVDLAKKIANFGFYAQIYLADIHENVKIGTDGYAQMSKFGKTDIDVSAAKEALAVYEAEVSDSSDILSLLGSSVSFDAATVLNYYVKAENGVKPEAFCKDKTAVVTEYEDYEPKADEKVFIISVLDIAATELASDFTVTLNGELTVTGSVLAYCSAAMSKNLQTNAAKNAMTAFYEYYLSAKEYSESKSMCTVHFFTANVGGTKLPDVLVKAGEKVGRPGVIPTAAGYVFEDWYTDPTYTNKWDFDVPVTENATVYGKFVVAENKVSIVVADIDTEEPMKGLSVTFDGETKITDEEGRVEYSYMPYGMYRLEIACDDYKTYTEDVTLNNDALNKNIYLRKMIPVYIETTLGGIALDNTGTPQANYIEVLVPSGTKVLAVHDPGDGDTEYTDYSRTSNTDPTITFLDPDGGSGINYYFRKSGGDIRFKKFSGVPLPDQPVTSDNITNVITIRAEFEPDPDMMQSLERTDNAGNMVRYLPICNGDHPISPIFTFYDADRNPIPKTDFGYGVIQYTMEDLKNAYYYTSMYYGSTFTAVRSISDFSYNAVFGQGGTGVKAVDPNWAYENLLAFESVEVLSTYPGPVDQPKVDGVSLSDIWRAYQGVAGFSDGGRFISCVAMSDENFFLWDCYDDFWYIVFRDFMWSIDLLVSRVFE